jgi:hypothetical protein
MGKRRRLAVALNELLGGGNGGHAIPLENEDAQTTRLDVHELCQGARRLQHFAIQQDASNRQRSRRNCDCPVH